MNGVPMRRGAAPWLVFLLAAAALWLAAAEPAAAQVTTGTVTSPLFLGKSNLNGATINLRTARTYTNSFNNTGFWTLSGVPSGATVSVSSASVASGVQRSGSVTLSYTGDFTEDFTLTLELNYSGFQTGDEERYSIPVLANGTRRLVVGSVTGQPTEAGGQATFTVALGTPISAAVSVSVSSQDSTEGTVSPSDLTFSTSNWATAQTVTVTGATDDVDDGDVTWQVRLDPASEGSGGDSDYHALANVDVDVTTTDDDTFGITVTPATSTSNRLRTSEDGSTETFTVVLDSEPTGDVVLDVASSDTAQGTVDTDSVMNGLQSALTFTTSNWNTAQTVTLTGVDDSPGTADGSQTYTVSVRSNIGMTQDAKYNGLAGVTAYAINADDELGLDVGAVMGQATEAGGTATFTVALLTQPTAAVTVAVSSLDATEGRASPSSMTFGTSDWNVNQTVTVTGANDDVDDGDVGWAVRLDPSSGDSDYNAAAVDVDVAVTTTDDDTAALTVSPTTSTTSRLRTTEAGGQATFTVVLATEPTGNVVLDVASALTTEGTVSASSLTFTASSWDTAQTVTLTGANDDVDDGDRNYDVTLTVNQTNTADTVYDALPAVTVYAANADDDEAGVTVSPETSTTQRLRTTEAEGTDTFTVVLDTEPAGNVVLDVASTDTAQGTVSPADLTFTASNWSTAQTVTLTGVDDDHPVNNPGGSPDGSQNYTVTLTVDQTNTLDDNYDTLGPPPAAAATVYARNLDDEAGVEVSIAAGTTLTTTEAGGAATFTVVLLSAPEGADVTIPVTSSEPSEGAVSPERLVFTPQNATTPQTVTVTGVDDPTDDGDQNYTIVTGDPSSADPTYDGLGAGDVDDVSVVNEDDEAAPRVTLAVEPSSISENGGETRVTATLSHPSIADTTVTVAAVEGVYTVGSDATIVIVAGGTTAEADDKVTVTAENNEVDAPDAEVTVTGTAENRQAEDDGETVAVTGAALTIEDDDEKGLVFALAGSPEGRVQGLDVPEGEPVAYTVVLTSMPTATVSVSVTVAAGNTSLTVSTASLTFTPDDWNTAQTVTVTAEAGADGHANEASRVSHEASGGGYDDEAFRLPVSVRGVTTVQVKVAAGETTTTTYTVEGREVRVTVGAGVPEDIVLDFAGVGSAPADAEPATRVLSEAEVPERTIAEAEGDGFNLGPHEGSRTVVDIEVTDTPLRVSLPVDAAVVAAAGDTARLRLLRYDGSAWMVVEGAEYVPGTGTEPGRMVASLPGNSPFATGYADTQPSFGDYALAAMVFTVDDAIEPVTLRESAGGDPPVTHKLTGPGSAATTLRLPEGLRWDEASRVLSGTPTEEFAPKDYIWTARDADGHSQTLTFTIEVNPARAKARARLKRINESILPELSRASWDSAMEAVVGRLESAAGGGGGGAPVEGLSSALAGFARSNERALEEDASWKELMSGQSFAVALGGEGEGEGAGFGRSVTVWGAGDRRRLSREVPMLKWSGDLYATHLGADVALDTGFTSGLGVSWYESLVGYEDRSEGETVKGVHRSRLASVQPYLGWSSAHGSRLWASVGYGTGEIEIVDEALLERYGRQKSDSELMAVAAGGAVRLLTAGAVRLDVKGEGHVTRYAVEDNGEGRDDLIEGLSVETRRVRMTAQGSREYVLDGGGSLSPLAELGVRWDGGDGAKGTGVELGGGVVWVGPGGGLKVDVGGRWLVAHGSEVEEWGLSGGVRLEPGRGGRGLSLSLEPGWGEVESGVSRLWDEGVSGGGGESRERAGAVLEAELGYGVSAFEGFGVATPYTRYGQGRDERRYGLGWRLSRGAGEGFELDVGTWRRERGVARAEHGVSLELRLDW